MFDHTRHPFRSRRALSIGSLLVATAFTTAACGGGESAAARTTAPPGPVIAGATAGQAGVPAPAQAPIGGATAGKQGVASSEAPIGGSTTGQAGTMAPAQAPIGGSTTGQAGVPLPTQSGGPAATEGQPRVSLPTQSGGRAATEGQPQIESLDPNSTNPVDKGKALSNSQCSGTGQPPLTHAPMDVKDIRTIQPMGFMIGGHVTPVDHEYYYQVDQNAPADTYPVFADADGTIVAVQHADGGGHQAWWITIAHTCTLLSNYNLMTSITPEIRAKLPANWGPNSNGGVNIPVKSGDLIGRVGHQSLDFQVWDTTKTLTGLLHATAYNNREPWKVNTVAPLDYFSADVKAQILPKYVRTDDKPDGKIDYDVSGQAVGNWFLVGTNGYAGSAQPMGEYSTGHLSLAYYYVDPSALVFSIGDYNGQAAQFAVKGDVDWTKITPDSGVVKLELAEQHPTMGNGQVWAGQLAHDVKLNAGPTKATALIQMTGPETMKVEVFAGKTPGQVSGFTGKAREYDRGQNATLIASNTAT